MNNPNVEIASKKVEKIKLDFKDSKYATGRRKKSIARVWVKKGSGKIYVNGKHMQDYFKRPVHQILVVRPLNEINASTEYDVKCRVTGGGLSGQAGALRHGISKALSLYDTGLRPALKKIGFLTRDPRMVERKKYGRRKARRAFQWVKR